MRKKELFSRSGLLVPYDVAEGSIRQTSVKLRMRSAVSPRSVYARPWSVFEEGLGERRHFLVALSQYEYA